MDELTKKRLQKIYEEEKREEEIFATIIADRLARQTVILEARNNIESSMISEVEVEDEDIYTIEIDEYGEESIKKKEE